MQNDSAIAVELLRDLHGTIGALAAKRFPADMPAHQMGFVKGFLRGSLESIIAEAASPELIAALRRELAMVSRMVARD